ncbi:MAG TPA: hypothetical protein VL284_19980 [Thermoanaerobaculia bacterium]|nr:hypothetical protein [Thermoanaerobaculia bacterium]
MLRRTAGSQPAGSRRRATWTLALAAMLVIVVAASFASIEYRREKRLESLRAERQRIETELQQVKAMADEQRPVVVLENGGTQLIVNREDPGQRPQFLYY